MSKFLDKLERIWEGRAQPIGFGAQAKAKSAPMLLVATLPRGRGDITALSGVKGVDAMLLPVEEPAREIEALSQLITAVGDIPVGVSVETATTEDMKRLTELGCDFIVFGANKMPAAILMEEGMGKVLGVDPALSDSLIRTISRLPIDAVLLEIGEQPLTVRQLMDYARITGLVGKPSLALLSPGLRTDDLGGLWRAGIGGVVLDIEQQRLSQVRETIQALKSAKGGIKKGVMPLIPTVSEEMGEIEEEI